ncbi:MAG: hypothetical protein ABIL68_00780, partial [bacterium]
VCLRWPLDRRTVVESILTKLRDIFNSQTALIEKYAHCQLEMEEKDFSQEADRLSEVAGNVSGGIENLKEMIGDFQMRLNRQKQ